MTRALTIWWGEIAVGTLSSDQHGEMAFVYDATWLDDATRPALSASLPKRAEPFKRRQCRPFFAGLLPEEAQRDTVARALGVSVRNDFRLLEALGGEVAGAISLWPEGQIPPSATQTGEATPLDDNALAVLLETLPRRPLLVGQGLRLSLAGAQAKLPVVLVDGKVALPRPGQPTTHIVKPSNPHFTATIENEALAMRLAERLGLAVAPVDTRIAAGRPYLLVTRYDRRTDPSGVRRLHQEDFCQALGIPPEQKYADEGGPTFKNSFELLRRACSRPAVEILKLLDAAIFNLMVGNSDAHGKNFSLLYGEGQIALAPLYDLLCTVAYEELSPTLAMKMGKSARLEDFNKRTWSAFAAEVGIGEPFVRRRAKALTDAVHEALPMVAEQISRTGLDTGALANYESLIASRATRLVKTI